MKVYVLTALDLSHSIRRMVARMNLTHTVGNIRNFINASVFVYLAFMTRLI